MKNNTWTIFKKECARFFGDRTMLMTTVVMPGLLIYIIYSFMGDNFMQPKNDGKATSVYVDNMPESLSPAIGALPFNLVIDGFDGETLKSDLVLKDSDFAYMVFPEDFDNGAKPVGTASFGLDLRCGLLPNECPNEDRPVRIFPFSVLHLTFDLCALGVLGVRRYLTRRARSPNAPQSRGKEKQLKEAQVTKGTSLRRRTVRVSCASFGRTTESRARDRRLSVRILYADAFGMRRIWRNPIRLRRPRQRKFHGSY